MRADRIFAFVKVRIALIIVRRNVVSIAIYFPAEKIGFIDFLREAFNQFLSLA